MDRKTLEYMEERAKKARLIVNKIAGLTKEAERLISTERISFADRHGNGLFTWHSDRDDSHDRHRTIRSLKTALVKVVADEIAELEKELAEL